MSRIADRFDVTESTVLRVVKRLTNAIIDLMANRIAWPKGARFREVVKGFEEMKGIDGVFDAIDGTHITVSGRDEYNENYINRKGYASVILQGVCDHQRLFY